MNLYQFLSLVNASVTTSWKGAPSIQPTISLLLFYSVKYFMWTFIQVGKNNQFKNIYRRI